MHAAADKKTGNPNNPKTQPYSHGKKNDMHALEAMGLAVVILLALALATAGPDPRKVDTSGVSYAAWVSVADVSASKSLGARRLHQECRLRVL